MLENCHFLLTFACQLTSSVSLTVWRRRSDAVIIKQTAETADQSCELNVHYVRDYSANMDSAPPQRSVGTFLWIRGNFHKIFCVIFFKMLKMFVTLHDVNGHTIQHFTPPHLYSAFIHNLHITLCTNCMYNSTSLFYRLIHCACANTDQLVLSSLSRQTTREVY